VTQAATRGSRNSQIDAALFVFMDALPSIALFQRRIEELAANMAEPAFYSNPRRAAEITREHQKLADLIADHAAFEKLGIEIQETSAMQKDPAADPGMLELAAAELPELKQRRDALRQAILLAM